MGAPSGTERFPFVGRAMSRHPLAEYVYPAVVPIIGDHQAHQGWAGGSLQG
jgi:hypothetical protein